MGAIGFGTSFTTWDSLVPKPPARITACIFISFLLGLLVFAYVISAGVCRIL